MLFVQSGLRLSLVIKFNVPGFRGSNEVNNSDVMAITINNVKIKVKELMKFWHLARIQRSGTAELAQNWVRHCSIEVKV